MFVTAKTVICVYGRLNKAVLDIEEVIEKACYGSFSSRLPAIKQIENVIELIERKNLLLNLKAIASQSLHALTKEEFEILAIKYGRLKKDLYLSRRTFFRKVCGALRSLERELSLRGITEETFKSDYADKVSFLGVERRLVLDKERACAKRITKLKLNKTFSAGKSGILQKAI